MPTNIPSWFIFAGRVTSHNLVAKVKILDIPKKCIDLVFYNKEGTSKNNNKVYQCERKTTKGHHVIKSWVRIFILFPQTISCTSDDFSYLMKEPFWCVCVQTGLFPVTFETDF